ncbi:MAG TPA: YncE family protein [Thermoplasmata archaeon]|nr:YncE family protein [Thermoplasmata archaeon]
MPAAARAVITILAAVLLASLVFFSVMEAPAQSGGKPGITLDERLVSPMAGRVDMSAGEWLGEGGPPAPGVGIVRQTLDLSNGTLLPGNFQPTSCSYLQDDIAVAALDAVFASCGSSNSLVEFNASTGAVVGTVNVGDDPVGLTFDPVNQEVYVANLDAGGVSVVAATNLSLVGAVDVGGSPINVAYDNATDRLYVSNSVDGNVTVINATDNSILTQVSLGPGAQPDGIAYDAYDREVYVADSEHNRVYVISGDTNQVAGFVNVTPDGHFFGGINALECDPATGAIYVSFVLYSNLFEINASTETVVNVSTPSPPSALAVDSANGRVYAVTQDITAWNATTLVETGSLTTGPAPGDDFVDGATGRLYVADFEADDVTSVDAQTLRVLGHFYADTEPLAVAWENVSRHVVVVTKASGVALQIDDVTNQAVGSTALAYGLGGIVADGGSGSLLVSDEAGDQVFGLSDTGGVEWNRSVPDGPAGGAYDPLNGEVYFADSVGNAVSALYGLNGTVAATIALPPPGGLGGGPQDVAVDPQTGDVFVSVNGCSCGAPGNVTILNGSDDQVVGGIYDWGDPGPTALAYDAENNELYVDDAVADVLWAFNATTYALVATAPVGVSPEGVAVDSENGLVYVTNSGSNNVSVVNGSDDQVIGSLSVGENPVGIALDPANGCLYVTNEGSDTLSILGNNSFAVTFEESGLPSGTTWSVTAGNTTKVGVGTSIEFMEPDGTLNYTVPVVSGWHLPGFWHSGAIAVDDASVTVPLVWQATNYSATFTEAGLPTGSSWSLTLNGSTYRSSNNTIGLVETNGSFDFVIASNTTLIASPASGVLNVSGHAMDVPVTFRAAATTSAPALLLGLPPWAWAAILGAVAASLAAVAYVIHRRKGAQRTTEPPEVD